MIPLLWQNQDKRIAMSKCYYNTPRTISDRTQIIAQTGLSEAEESVPDQ